MKLKLPERRNAMSMITECTVLIKADCENLFLEEIKKIESDFRLSDVTKCYGDEKNVVYRFDCNGNNPFQLGYDNEKLDFSNGVIAAETCYLEDGFVWNSVKTKNGGCKDADRHISGMLKKLVPAEKLKEVRGMIAYSR